MEFVNLTDKHEGRPTLGITHAGEVLLWDVSIHRQGEKTSIDIAIKYINDYFANLSYVDQQAIFGCYVEARQALSNTMDDIMLTRQLISIVKRLYSIIVYENVSTWAKRHLSIMIPSKIKSNYDDLDISKRNQMGKSYREKTYIYEEYVELIHLAIYLKPMIPIWGEYIKIKNKPTSTKTHLSRDRNLYTKNNFREYEAFSLLSGSPAMTVAPMERLQQYVETSIDFNKQRISSILGGLGSSELPEWCLAMVVVRRLTMIELSIPTKTGVISLVYHFLTNTINSLEGKFLGQAREKNLPKSNEEDDNKSVLEAYKVKQEISLGDLVAISVFSENMGHLIDIIDPTVPKDILEACLEYKRELKYFLPHPVQMTLMGWVLSEIVPPRAIFNLSREAMLSCLGASIALLWHWGFTDLVGYLTAVPDVDEDGMLIGGTSIKVRLTRQELMLLDTYFPYPDQHGQNVASKGIDDLVKDFSHSDWILSVPDALKTTLSHPVAPIPTNIKSRLTELVVILAKQTELKLQHPIEESLHV